jgi:hypothetical protein
MSCFSPTGGGGPTTGWLVPSCAYAGQSLPRAGCAPIAIYADLRVDGLSGELMRVGGYVCTSGLIV